MSVKILTSVVCLTLLKFSDAGTISWTFPTNGDASTPARNEGTSTIATILATTDGGATINGYALDVASTVFEVNSGTGVISLISGQVLDYEAATSYKLIVKATDDAGASKTGTVTVVLADVNDNSPAYGSPTDTVDVCNTIAAGEEIGTYAATDLDGTPANRVLAYTVSGGDDNPAQFTYESSTGVLKKSAEALGTRTVYTLVLHATNDGAPTPTAAMTLTATIKAAACSASAIAAGMAVVMATVLTLLHDKLL